MSQSDVGARHDRSRQNQLRLPNMNQRYRLSKTPWQLRPEGPALIRFWSVDKRSEWRGLNRAEHFSSTLRSQHRPAPNPCTADTTQDAPEHAIDAWEESLKSTLAMVTPSLWSRSSLSRAVPWRTRAFTSAPLSSKALVMRPPRLPVAPATTMADPFINPISVPMMRNELPGTYPSAAGKRDREAIWESSSPFSTFQPRLLHINLELSTTLQMARDPRHLHFPIPEE